MTPASGDLGRAALVYLVLTGAFLWPVFTGRAFTQTDALWFMSPWDEVRPASVAAAGNRMLDDQTREFLPFFLVARESLSRGELPLWNPTIFLGTPLLADSQSAVLYPLNLGHYVLPPPWGFTASAAAKLFLAALAAYLLARRLGASHAGGLVAGTTYGFAAFDVFWLSHPHTNVALLLPLGLVAVEAAVRRPGRAATAGIAAVVGLQLLGGHVELTFLSAVAAGTWLLLRALQARARLLPRLRVFVAGYLLGAGLGAIVLVPFLELLLESITWQVRSAHNPFFAPPLELATLVLPDVFLLPGWGGGHVLHGLSLYTGVATLLLALVGAAAGGRPAAFPLVVLAAIGLAIGFGVPPLDALLVRLPLFRQNPNYYALLFTVLAVSQLAGLGLDALAGRTLAGATGRRRALALAGACGAVLAGLAACAVADGALVARGAAELGAPDPGAVGRAASAAVVRAAAWLVAAALLAVAALRGARGSAGAALLLVYADLWVAGSGWNPAVPPASAWPPTPPALAATVIPRGATPPRVAAIGDVLPPNTGVYAGLHDVRGYDVPVAARYHDFFRRALGGRDVFWVYELPALEPRSLPFLDAAAAAWLLTRGEPPAGAASEPVYEGTARVSERRSAFPRAYLVRDAEPAQGREQALERVLALGEGLRRRVVLEGAESSVDGVGSAADLAGTASPGAGADATGGGAAEPRPARITRYESRRVEIEADAPWPGWLVLTDAAYPGWRARVDGIDAPIAVANSVFRAVRVPSGVHRVEFLYTPWSARLGATLSLVCLGCCLWLWTRGR